MKIIKTTKTVYFDTQDLVNIKITQQMKFLNLSQNLISKVSLFVLKFSHLTKKIIFLRNNHKNNYFTLINIK